jgi:hypothetical protein
MISRIVIAPTNIIYQYEIEQIGYPLVYHFTISFDIGFEYLHMSI